MVVTNGYGGLQTDARNGRDEPHDWSSSVISRAMVGD